MNKESKIFVAGHRGMVGSAIVRRLQAEGFTQILTRNRSDLDLLDRLAVRRFFEIERPEFVFDAAARVGGIIANSEKPVEFLIENLTIQNNVIQAAADFGAAKLLFLGSSCIYPKLAPQPISEDSLLTGPLEPTNDAYALAKIAEGDAVWHRMGDRITQRDGAWWYSGSCSISWLRWLRRPVSVSAFLMRSGITSEFSVPSSLMRA